MYWTLANTHYDLYNHEEPWSSSISLLFVWMFVSDRICSLINLTWRTGETNTFVLVACRFLSTRTLGQHTQQHLLHVSEILPHFPCQVAHISDAGFFIITYLWKTGFVDSEWWNDKPWQHNKSTNQQVSQCLFNQNHFFSAPLSYCLESVWGFELAPLRILFLFVC